jgi:antitoxin (DNA-binding transcriptional repressor) of toxin-antitoxin stability system
MPIVHMTEDELARDVRAVLTKVRQGTEIVIEQNHQPIAVIKPSRTPGPGPRLSDLAKAYEAKLGYAPTPDDDFAADVQAGIDARRGPLDPPARD